MKRILKLLVAVIMAVTMFLGMSMTGIGQSEVRAEYLGPYPGMTYFDGDVYKNNVFGYPLNKPRFAVDGVEMIEGADFEFLVRPEFIPNSGYYNDYIGLGMSGWFQMAVLMHNEWARDRMAGGNSGQTIFDLYRFYVYPVEEASCRAELTALPYTDPRKPQFRIDHLYAGNYEVPLDGCEYSIWLSSTEKKAWTVHIKSPYTCIPSSGFSVMMPLNPLKLTQSNTTCSMSGKLTYNGSAQHPNSIEVFVNQSRLSSGVDYDIEFDDNPNAGTHYVKITGLKYVSGTVSFPYEIAKCNVSSVVNSGSFYFVQENNKIVLKDRLNLTKDVDYKVTVDQPIKLSDRNDVTVEGLGNNYTGKTKVSCYCNLIDFSSASVSDIKFEYDPGRPLADYIKPSVYCQGGLTEGTDYTIDLSGCTTTLGKHKYKIIGKNNFLGSIEGSYTIQKDISDFELDCPDQYYTGKPVIPDLSDLCALSKDGDTYILMPDRFDVSITNNTELGNAHVKVKGKGGNYTGTFEGEFKILPRPISDCTVNYDKTVTFNGVDAAVPNVTVKFGDKTLVADRDYDIKFTNNKAGGTGKLTVTGLGYYSGSKTFDFTVYDPTKPTATPVVTKAPKVTSKPGVTNAPKVTGKPTVTSTPAVTNRPGVTNVPEVTAKPAVTNAPQVTDKPQPVITKTVITPVPDSDSAISDFVDRIYEYVLDRDPDAEGTSFWTSELHDFNRTGAEVGLQFIFSDEFTSRGLSDSDFVTVLYKTFFGRDPEADGLSFWTSALSDGSMDRMAVANGFVYSQEWADTCARYGIRSGGVEPSVEISPSEATSAFVERMYTTAMNRASDTSGKEFWAKELSNFRYTGEQVGVMFFLSEEMQGFGLSDEEFVTRLYKTFMDRDPEEGGFNFWVGYLADGGSREGAVLGFTRSEEFVNKCVEARILPY